MSTVIVESLNATTDARVSRKHLVESRVDDASIAHHQATVHDGVPGADRTTSQPRLHRIGDGTSECRPGERPHRDVGNGTDAQLSDLALTTEATRAADGGNF
jgi:hypothetical protein